MATKLDVLKWSLYKKKREYLILFGGRNGYVFPYGKELIEI